MSTEFINYLADIGKIRFAPMGEEITFKCGRKGGHFMNISAGNGEELNKIAQAYVEPVMKFYNKYGPDTLLFGPAYKGITLVAAVAMLCNSMPGGTNINFCYNRKEQKDHGEMAKFDGTKPQAHHKVVIIEDVITAGTSVGEVAKMLEGTGAEIVGEVLMVDRQETMLDDHTQTALQAAERKYEIDVIPILTLREIMEVLLNYETPDGTVVLDQERYDRTMKYLATHGPQV